MDFYDRDSYAFYDTSDSRDSYAFYGDDIVGDHGWDSYTFYRWGDVYDYLWEVVDDSDSYSGDDNAKNFIYKNFENSMCGRDSRPITQNPLFYFGNQVTPWAIGQSPFDHSLNVHFNSIV